MQENSINSTKKKKIFDSLFNKYNPLQEAEDLLVDQQAPLDLVKAISELNDYAKQSDEYDICI